MFCLSLALTLGGCGSPEAASAASTATRFVDLASEDPGAACGILAPPTREKATEDGDGDCAEGLRAADLSAASSALSGSERPAEVAGHTAIVTTGGQTIFLTLFEDGWKVLAAGCRRVSEDQTVPYDCALEGD